MTVDGTVTVTDGAGALNVIVDSSALPSGAATAANQLPDGHNVTVDNGAGVSAVNIQDGGNLISIDDGAGSITIDNAALSVTGGGTEASALRVTIANNSTGVLSVDDNGSSLTVDGTLSCNLNAGTNNIGDVDVVSFPDNEPFNVAQMNGVAVSMGSGVNGTGVQRVTIATNDEINDDLDDIRTAVQILDDWDDGGDKANVVNYAKDDTCTTLTALNVDYDTTSTETNSSADVTTTGYRRCDLLLTIDSTGTPTTLEIFAQAKSGSTYFDMQNGFLGKFIYDDTAVATAQNVHVTFPCPTTGTMRVTITGTGLTAATNYFTVSNAELCLGT